MRKALIGYTGFVGSFLQAQADFTHKFNSKNFKEMIGQEFEQVVCCGISAVKWKANKEPELDQKQINELIDVLKTVKASKFIHISTIDIYPTPYEVNETFVPDGQDNHAYGLHRYQFEQFLSKTFNDLTIVRLPGLFGDGLKKNVIFDLINNNCLEMINPKSSFQYYDLNDLWNHINTSLENNLKVVNFATPPILTQSIIDKFFPGVECGSEAGPSASYDMQTIYGKSFEGDNKYICQRNVIMKKLETFINNSKRT